MGKSQTVRYTSEELKQMPSESDWDAADAMTEEEINAAIASDPEEASMGKDWMKRGKRFVRVNGKMLPARHNPGNTATPEKTNTPMVEISAMGRLRARSTNSGTVNIYGSFSDSEWGFLVEGKFIPGSHDSQKMPTNTSKRTTGELIYR